MLECYHEQNFNKYKTHFIFGYLTMYVYGKFENGK